MLLAKQGVDVNQTANGGCTPLYIASENGRSEVVSVLLDKQGVDMNQTDNFFGRTPLCIASENGAMMWMPSSAVSESTPLFCGFQYPMPSEYTQLNASGEAPVDRQGASNSTTGWVTTWDHGHEADPLGMGGAGDQYVALLASLLNTSNTCLYFARGLALLILIIFIILPRLFPSNARRNCLSRPVQACTSACTKSMLAPFPAENVS